VIAAVQATRIIPSWPGAASSHRRGFGTVLAQSCLRSLGQRGLGRHVASHRRNVQAALDSATLRLTALRPT
jgi:hypothetical protein